MRRMLFPDAEIGYPARWWGKTVDVPSALPLSLSSLNSGAWKASAAACACAALHLSQAAKLAC